MSPGAVKQKGKCGFKGCRRDVVHGVRCWQHSQIESKLRVKKSTTKGAGLGLFAAKKAYHKGEKIDEYKGPKLSLAQVNRLPEAHQAYCVELMSGKYRGKFIDGAGTRTSYARFANEANRKHGENAIIEDPPRRKKYPVLVAEKPIKSNQEVRTDYGPNYPDRQYKHWRN